MECAYQVWLDKERDLEPDERIWLNRLLSQEFPGRAVLVEQAQVAKVSGYCSCGCGSVSLKIPEGLLAYPYSERIPVEMEIEQPPLLFLLHVVGGYIDELELVWGELERSKNPISVENARITVNV